MLITAIVIIGGYLAIVLALYAFQDYFLFFPQKLSANSSEVLKYKQAEIRFTVDGVTLQGWLLNRGREKLLIYYGGNAEEASWNIPDLQNLDSYSVLLINYRGYGLSEGKPGEKAMFSDALTIFDRLSGELNIQPDNIVLMGRSLGSGVAVYVASKRKVGKLILVTPYDSIVRVAQSKFPFVPVGLILRNKFDSLKYAKAITCPTLFIMGGHDQVIPNSHTLNLIDHWPGNYRKILIDRADHNDINTYPEYWETIEEFIKCERF